MYFLACLHNGHRHGHFMFCVSTSVYIITSVTRQFQCTLTLLDVRFPRRRCSSGSASNFDGIDFVTNKDVHENGNIVFYFITCAFRVYLNSFLNSECNDNHLRDNVMSLYVSLSLPRSRGSSALRFSQTGRFGS